MHVNFTVFSAVCFHCKFCISRFLKKIFANAKISRNKFAKVSSDLFSIFIKKISRSLREINATLNKLYADLTFKRLPL